MSREPKYVQLQQQILTLQLEQRRIHYRACQLFVDLRIDNFGLEDIQGVGELLSAFAERAGCDHDR